jgi:RNA polymerase sigma factor
LLSLSFISKPKKERSLEDAIKRIKAGDNDLKEKLLIDYKPFIIKSISKVTKRYVDEKNSDELSIGYMAFNEAIDCYNTNKGCGFLSFCDSVIQRRVIDYVRKNSKHAKTYPLSHFEGEDGEAFEEKYLSIAADTQYEHVETKEEIMAFEEKLGAYGITLEELVVCCPKHKDSKLLSIDIARVIADRDDLFEKLDRKKCVPMSDLMKLVNVNPKTVERNRKFIIAVVLILRSDIEILKGYINDDKRGGGAHE